MCGLSNGNGIPMMFKTRKIQVSFTLEHFLSNQAEKQNKTKGVELTV